MAKLVSIVIPTYNESRNLPLLIPRIDKAMQKARMHYECIVVDDNSSDGTYEIAKKLSKKYNVRVFLRTNERGLSSAMLHGFNHSKGDVVGWIDADLQHSPELIPDLVRAITDDGYLVAVGSRLVKGGGVKGWALHRRFISWVARLLAKPLTNVRDTMSGFLFIKPEVLKGVKVRTIGYKLGLEVMVRGKHNNKIKEVPYVFVHRAFDKSKMTWKTNLDYLRQIAFLYAYKIRKIFK
ncbi:MAG: polyprenol monophosphomannose synthase [Candidatus Woesearchaeota archaeon]